MAEHEPCSAYQDGSLACSNGFFQKPFCRGSVGCFSCGAISEASIPHCLKDELPEHWISEDGKPRFVPRSPQEVSYSVSSNQRTPQRE